MKDPFTNVPQTTARGDHEWQQILWDDSPMDAVAKGRLTPEQADAALIRSGREPLSYQPDPSEFNPMEEPRWNMFMALAWIMWRTQKPSAISGPITLLLLESGYTLRVSHLNCPFGTFHVWRLW
jgi:hypothetical protein